MKRAPVGLLLGFFAVALSIAAQANAPSAAPLRPSVDLEEFARFVESGNGAVVDARPRVFYRLGHVPGAVSLPRENFATAFDEFHRRTEAKPETRIVVYCSDATCGDADKVRAALLERGFQRVQVFPGGWAEWTSARLPQER